MKQYITRQFAFDSGSGTKPSMSHTIGPTDFLNPSTAPYYILVILRNYVHDAADFLKFESYFSFFEEFSYNSYISSEQDVLLSALSQTFR
jgi:hypothetical protein